MRLQKKQGRFKGRKPKYTLGDEGLQRTIELYKEGNTEKAIERKTGINRMTFRRYREKLGIEVKGN